MLSHITDPQVGNAPKGCFAQSDSLEIFDEKLVKAKSQLRWFFEKLISILKRPTAHGG